MIANTLLVFAGVNFLSICYILFMNGEGFGYLPILLLVFSLFSARYFFMSREEEASKLDTWSKA